MKIYRGQPGGQVTVEDGGKVTKLPAIRRGNFSWGKGKGGPEGTNLALSLAANVLGDADEANKVHQRLKHRTVMAWPADTPWSINERELMAHIDDIRDVEKSTAMTRTIVNQQPPPVVYEGGGGIPGVMGPIKRSDKDQGPGPEVPPERRQKPARKPGSGVQSTTAVDAETHHGPNAGRGGPSRPDDWPEKIDGFRRTTGDFLAGTRMVYCLVLCNCYSWQDAAGVSQERLAEIPEWSDGLMAEMMDSLSRRGIVYAARERRQEILRSALSKLTTEEREALGLK